MLSVAKRLDSGVRPVGAGGPRVGVAATAIDVSVVDMVAAIVPKGSSAKFTEKQGSVDLAPLA